jgi:hypothetical protein
MDYQTIMKLYEIEPPSILEEYIYKMFLFLIYFYIYLKIHCQVIPSLPQNIKHDTIPASLRIRIMCVDS